jgi:cell division protein FtsQ
MAERHQNTSRTRKPTRQGRARQRQVQRENAVELRQSISRVVSADGLRSSFPRPTFPKLKAPSWKSVREKLVGLNPNGLLRRSSTRRSTTDAPNQAETGSRTRRTENRRKTVRVAVSAQPVLNFPRRAASLASGGRSLVNEPRLRRERRTTTHSEFSLPPVLVRGGTADMAVRRSKPGLPKRRYDIALGVPGAELHLPSLPMVHMGWRALSGLLVVMMVACLFFLWKSPAFLVNTVEAEGLQRLTVGDLNAVMGILGNSVFSIDLQELEQALIRAFPELGNVRVSAGLPARISVSVTERQPVLAWFQDNREVWVDAEGVAFAPRGNPGSLVRVEGHGSIPAAIAGVFTPAAGSIPPGVVYVPIAIEGSGEAGKAATLPVDLVETILTLGSKIPPETQLVYDSQHGLGWEDPAGWEVYFGTQTSDMEQRLVVYQGVVQHLTNQGIQPTLVSVEYVHAPYYRMEP